MEHRNGGAGGYKTMSAKRPQLPYRSSIASDHEGVALVQSTHDPTAVISKFALGNLLAHKTQL
jgi:hypothetical protein